MLQGALLIVLYHISRYIKRMKAAPTRGKITSCTQNHPNNNFNESMTYQRFRSPEVHPSSEGMSFIVTPNYLMCHNNTLTPSRNNECGTREQISSRTKTKHNINMTLNNFIPNNLTSSENTNRMQRTSESNTLAMTTKSDIGMPIPKTFIRAPASTLRPNTNTKTNSDIRKSKRMCKGQVYVKPTLDTKNMKKLYSMQKKSPKMTPYMLSKTSSQPLTKCIAIPHNTPYNDWAQRSCGTTGAMLVDNNGLATFVTSMSDDLTPQFPSLTTLAYSGTSTFTGKNPSINNSPFLQAMPTPPQIIILSPPLLQDDTMEGSNVVERVQTIHETSASDKNISSENQIAAQNAINETLDTRSVVQVHDAAQNTLMLQGNNGICIQAARSRDIKFSCTPPPTLPAPPPPLLSQGLSNRTEQLMAEDTFSSNSISNYSPSAYTISTPPRESVNTPKQPLQIKIRGVIPPHVLSEMTSIRSSYSGIHQLEASQVISCVLQHQASPTLRPYTIPTPPPLPPTFTLK